MIMSRYLQQIGWRYDNESLFRTHTVRVEL